MRDYKKLAHRCLAVLMAQTNLSFSVQIQKNLIKRKESNCTWKITSDDTNEYKVCR